jgi:hypothetical protein
MVTIEEDTLAKLNQTYIDTRYPARLGFSPNGLPDNKGAEIFYERKRQGRERGRVAS